MNMIRSHRTCQKLHGNDDFLQMKEKGEITIKPCMLFGFKTQIQYYNEGVKIIHTSLIFTISKMLKLANFLLGHPKILFLRI